MLLLPPRFTLSCPNRDLHFTTEGYAVEHKMKKNMLAHVKQ